MGRPNLRLPILVSRSVEESRAASDVLVQGYDSYMRQERLSCRKGCSNCCYHPVVVTLLEGLRIYAYLRDHNLWSTTLKTTLQEHAEKVQNLSLEIWNLGLIACPFLKEDLCQIYEGRPFSCKVTYSLGDPDDCHPHKMGAGMVPRATILQVQAMSDTPLLARHQLPYFRVPLSVALLYADKVSRDELSLEDCKQALWKTPE